MHVLLMTQYYWPETVGAGVWTHQLARDLVKKGHRVTVLTAFPNYPAGRVFSAYRRRLFARELHEEIEIIRTYIYAAAGKSLWRRALSFGSFCVSALFGGLLVSHPDVIYAILPPTLLGSTAELLGAIKRCPSVINLQDIYPDVAVSNGYLKNSFAIKAFKTLERSVYRHASAIVLIGETFRENLTTKGVDPGKLRVIPNWADADAITPSSKFNSFRESLGWNGAFLAIYSGGMGMNTCLDTVIDAARILQTDGHRFALIGEGTHKADLEAKSRRLKLENIRFLPFVALDQYPLSLAASDVQIVALNEGATQASLPSKVLKIMASGRPVIALAHPKSELSTIVSRSQCGVTVMPGDSTALADVLRKLAADPEGLNAMGRRARQYLVENFERRYCTGRLESVLREVVRA